MTAAPEGRFARWFPWLIFPALALWQTRRAFFSPVAVILGGANQPDWTGTLWTWWWTWTALLSGRSPTTATANLFPVGLDPVAQYNLVDGILLGWLIPAVGPTRGFNLAGLLLLASAGGAGFSMCRRFGLPRWSSTFAGLLFQSSAMILVEITAGRFSQALVWFAALAFVGLLQLTAAERPLGQAVRTGVWMALAALTYWYVAIFVAIGALPAVIRGWRHFARTTLAAGTCVLLCAPAVFALYAYGEDLPGLHRAAAEWMSADDWTRGRFGTGMAMASSHQPFWPFWDAPGDPMDKRLSPILVALGVAGAIWGPARWRTPLLGAIAGGWLLSLGPWLKAPHGEHLPIPLPWLLFEEWVPYFDRLWWPERFELTVMLGLIPLAGFGLTALGERWGVRRTATALAVVWLAELAWANPYASIPASPPPAFDGDLYSKVDGPLVTLPVLAPDPDIRHTLWMQVLHGQPVTAGLGEHLDGHVSERWTRYVAENGLLSALHDANSQDVAHRVITPADVDALRSDGLRWVVLDRVVLPRASHGAWMRRETELLAAVWGPPDVETSNGRAWRIRPIEGPRKIPSLGPPPPRLKQGPFALQR